MDWIYPCGVVVVAMATMHPSTSLRLPDYMKPCKINAELDACALRHGQAAISHVIGGDPKYRIPKLEPLQIPRLVINQGTNQVGLNLTLKDCNIHGLSKAQFTASRMDMKNRHVEWDFLVPRISLLGIYKGAGRILVLPITGNGNGNITLLNMKISYKFDFQLENRKGEDYVKLTSSKLVFNTTRMYVHMDNLFNGDRVLGGAMNRFLDENWRDVVGELGPSVGDAIGAVFKLLITNIAALVPYRHIFIL